MQRTRFETLVPAIAAALLGSAQAATFTVTKTEDSGDDNVGSLRWAIVQANNNSGLDTIAFAIGSGAQTITLASPLPMLSGDLTQINGATQPGYNGTPLIRIDGSALPATTRGLYLRGDQLGINALSLTGFGAAAIFGDQFTADGVVVGCYIGLQQDGSSVGANGTGIYMDGNGYYLGGTTPQTRNVIAGNTGAGIRIGVNGFDNRAWGNYIGTAPSGLSAQPNGGDGIAIDGHGNVIGDITSNRRNVLSGNSGAGVRVDGHDNQVLGNYIGVGPDGLTVVGNEYGVLLYGDHNTIGGSGGGANIISGNTGHGIYARFLDGLTVAANRIGTGADGLVKRGNGGSGIYLGDALNVVIGGAASADGNVISGNDDGIYATGASGLIKHNLIGLAADGTAPLGNSVAGIRVYDSVLDIGDDGAGNTISGNAYTGVLIDSGTVSVKRNQIGTDRNGSVARPNPSGLGIGDATVLVSGNLISGNSGDGIAINGTQAQAEIIDNRIGPNAAGNAPLGNGSSGIRVVRAAPGLIIGSAGHGNVISGNYRGVTLDDSTAQVIVQGNRIGTDVTGNTPLGNTETALLMGGEDHQIGGIDVGSGNIIAASSSAMRIGAGGGHHIEGNFIGTNASLANGFGNALGIIVSDASDMVIGGASAGAGNVVINSSFSGIRLEGGQGNSVLGNRVYANAGYNIDIAPDDGPNVNDPLDVDQGPNLRQNYPELTSAQVSGMNLQFAGVLRSRANSNYRVEYFQSTNCHPSGFGQGQSYIGHENVLSNAAGLATLSFLGSNGNNSGFVSATATDADGNTSEFGNCIAIGSAGPGQFNIAAQWHFSYEDIGVAHVYVTRTNGADGATSVQFNSANHVPATALAGADYSVTGQTLNFAHGETAKMVSVPILSDALVEGMEDFDVVLSGPTNGATLGALATGRVVIYDHDPSLTRASIDDAIVSEPVNGSAQAVFTVTMGADAATRNIDYSTVDASATAGSDYVAKSGTLSFLPGETTKTIAVTIKADAQLEDDEAFELQLSESDPNLQLLRDTGIGAILNTGGAPILFSDNFED